MAVYLKKIVTEYVRSSHSSESYITRRCIYIKSTNKLFEHGLVNYTPLTALLVGLALGQCERNLDKINDSANWPDYQSQYLAVIAARDIILRNSTHYPLFFQLMLADQLTVQHVSKACREFLSTYRVASNINTSSRRLFTKNILKYNNTKVKILRL